MNNGEKILDKLAEMEKEEGMLPLLLQFYREIFLVQKEVLEKIGASQMNMTRETIRERMQQGIPLLAADNINIDMELARETFDRIKGIFSRFPELFGKIPDSDGESETGLSLTPRDIKAWLNGEKLPEDGTDIKHEAINRAMIHFTIKPLLMACAGELIKQIEPEHWRRKTCPVCGGAPDLAYLDTERGSKWLICSCCDSEWLFKRLECPFCGTQDQKALAFYTDNKEMYRLYVCESCKRYLKTIDLRRADGEVILPLERILTVDMDKQALTEGYVSPG